MLDSFAVVAQAGGASGGGIGQMMPMFVIFGIMFFWMYRTQKKEKDKREKLLASIKAGDKIITAGGILAEVVSVKDSSYIIKLAEKVNVEITKAGLATVVRDEKKSVGEK